MVKLVTAREIRLYGPGMARKRTEYINTGLYLFAKVVLLSGFLAEMSREPRSGIIIGVNLHDLIAHLAWIDYRLSLVWLDVQLAFIEITVPIINALGGERIRGLRAWKAHDELAGVILVLWPLVSVHNSCQVYETAGAHVQILQESVLIPFLTGSLLLLVAAIINAKLGGTRVWPCAFGSLPFIVGGLANVAKVFGILQLDEMLLEKLPGGSHERLVRHRFRDQPRIACVGGYRGEEPSEEEAIGGGGGGARGVFVSSSNK